MPSLLINLLSSTSLFSSRSALLNLIFRTPKKSDLVTCTSHLKVIMEKLRAPHPPPYSTDLRLSNSSEVGGEVARLLWNIDGGGLHLLASSAIPKKQLFFLINHKFHIYPVWSVSDSVTLLWTILCLSVLNIFLDINTKWIRYLVFNSDIFQWVMVNRPWISRKVFNGIFQDNLVLHRLTSYGHFCWKERWKELKKT